nr:YmdB family metallophosphoesterase [Candidatus Gracilibacteria bacterium]
MKILFLGDVFGKTGRQKLEQEFPNLKSKYPADLIIANVENAAHGRGVRQSDLDFFQDLGIQVFTSGNHIFQTKEAAEVL